MRCWEVVQLVGLQTLDLAILVRVQASQPIFLLAAEGLAVFLQFRFPVPTKTSSGNHQKLFVLHARHLSEQFEGQASCHKKLTFAWQTGTRLVLRSHTSVCRPVFDQAALRE